MPGLPNSRKRASLSLPLSWPEMSSERVEEEELPIVLTPIRTSLPITLAGASTTNTTEEREKEDNCVTPKNEVHDLKPTLLCPPAPRKPRRAKRKFSRPARELFVVTDDLESVFPIIAAPPKKKLQVG